jgi:hypothetical protein
MRFARRPVVNKLTVLFGQKGSPSVIDVLSNDDLSKSVTNEVPELIDFICPDPKDKSPPHLQELLDWALTEKYFSTQDRPFRFSQNAANIVSEPCSALQKRLQNDELGYHEVLDTLLHEFLIRDRPPSGRFLGHFSTIFMCVNRATQGGLLSRMRNREPRFDDLIIRQVDQVAMMPLISYFFSDCPDDFAGPYARDIGQCLRLILVRARECPRTGVCVFSLFHNMLQEFTELDLFIRESFIREALDILDRATDPLLVHKGFHFLRVALESIWDKEGEYIDVKNVIREHADRFKPADPNHPLALAAFQLYCNAGWKVLELFVEPFFKGSLFGFDRNSIFARAFVRASANLPIAEKHALLNTEIVRRLADALSVKVPGRPDVYVMPTNWNIIELVKEFINAAKKETRLEHIQTKNPLSNAVIDRVLSCSEMIDSQIHKALEAEY